MSNFDEKLKSICTYHSDDGTSGYQLSEDQFDQIKQLISEVIGEDEDERTYGNYSKDATTSRNQFRRKLRHAFNLKRE